MRDIKSKWVSECIKWYKNRIGGTYSFLVNFEEHNIAYHNKRNNKSDLCPGDGGNRAVLTQLSACIWCYISIRISDAEIYFTLRRGWFPCITTAIWRCRNPFSQRSRRFRRKPRSRWQKFLRQRYIAILQALDKSRYIWHDITQSKKKLRRYNFGPHRTHGKHPYLALTGEIWVSFVS